MTNGWIAEALIWFEGNLSVFVCLTCSTSLTVISSTGCTKRKKSVPIQFSPVYVHVLVHSTNVDKTKPGSTTSSQTNPCNGWKAVVLCGLDPCSCICTAFLLEAGVGLRFTSVTIDKIWKELKWSISEVTIVLWWVCIICDTRVIEELTHTD